MLKYILFLFFLYFVLGNCVFYPPSLTQQPVRDKVYQNKEVFMLRCVATGNPPPSYIWYKNNKVFDCAINVGRYARWPNEGTLIFAFPNDDDDGIYQCLAINDRGTALSVKSNVRRAEMQPFTTKDPRTLQLIEGTPIKLQCQAPISYPPPIIAWKKTKEGYTNLLKDSNKYAVDFDGNLIIAGVTVAEDDNFDFTCTAFNTRMSKTFDDKPYTLKITPSQAKVGVSIQYRSLQPIITRVDQKVTIRCILGGNPAPTYRWSLKGSTEDIMARPNINQEAGGAFLVINPVTKKDAGTYVCVGENSVSAKPLILNFQVKVLQEPKLIISLKDTNVTVNGSHEFQCEAIGDPIPQIEWTVNGKDLNTYLNGVNKRKAGNTIYLSQLTPADTAVFQCNASNPVGYDYSNGYINVMP